MLASVSETEAVGYVYFDYNDPKSYEPETITRSLLKQLLFKLRTVPDTLQQLCDESLQKGKSVEAASLKQHLLLMLTKFEHVYLVFDALDEISVELSKDVLALINEFRNAGANIFCTGRINTPRVRGQLGNPAVTEIRANQEDIVGYITVRLDREHGYDEESNQQILDCLVDKAQGQ